MPMSRAKYKTRMYMRNTVRMINPRDRWIAWIWITRGVSIRFCPLLSFLSAISIVVSVTSFVSLFPFCFFIFYRIYTSMLFRASDGESNEQFLFSFFLAFIRYTIIGCIYTKASSTTLHGSGLWVLHEESRLSYHSYQQVCEFLGTHFVYFSCAS